MKIRTEKAYVGWYAYDEETYDGAPDGDNTIGHGRTEQEAKSDFMEQLPDEQRFPGVNPEVIPDLIAIGETMRRPLSLADHCQEQPSCCPHCRSLVRCNCGKERGE